MGGSGYVCTLVLAGVFVWAAGAKMARRNQTAASFAALRLPASGTLATAVPVVELLLAVALIALPPVGGALSLLVVVVFTGVLMRSIRSGARPPCSCFGAARRDPVSGVDVLRNAFLAGLALAALFTPEPVRPTLSETAAALALCAVGAVTLATARRSIPTRS